MKPRKPSKKSFPVRTTTEEMLKILSGEIKLPPREPKPSLTIAEQKALGLDTETVYMSFNPLRKH